jgi:hypothetical protein
VSGQPPPAVGRLRQEYPGAPGERRITGRLNDESGESADDRELLVTIEGAGVREDLAPTEVLSPSTFERLDGGSSCTKAAVFFRNIAMSGTPSILINSVASFRANTCWSLNVPAVA